MTIEVEATGGVLVKAPVHVSQKVIDQFVLEAMPWIVQQKEVMRRRPQLDPKRAFKEGDLFLYLGEYYPLTIVAARSEPLRLFGEFQLSESHQHLARSAFMHWYKFRAREKFRERLNWYAKLSGFGYKQLKLSSARRSWGSCSVEGSINLSWRLIMAPPSVLDYIVVHELAHTQEHNHSSAFWAHVFAMMPNYKQQQKWLRDFGQLLDL